MGSAELTQQARIAIREGRLAEARGLMRQVIHQDPYHHAAWLLLAQATPNKRLAAQYIERAHQLKPGSPLVQSAQKRMFTGGGGNSKRRNVSFLAGIVLLAGLLVLLFGRNTWERAVAQQNSEGAAIPIAMANPFQAVVEKASSAQSDMPVAVLGVQPIPTLEPQRAPILPAATPTAKAPEELAERIDQQTGPMTGETSANAAQPVVIGDPDQALPAAIVSGIEAETKTNDEIISESADQQAADSSETNLPDDAGEETKEALVKPDEEVSMEPASDRWIDVNLTTQTLTAYEGDTAVLTSLISSGTWQYPTVTGQFNTWIKYESQNMTGYHLGYNYSLPNVPYVMYFYKDFAIHGAYWHNNFGTPMSHGCINMNPVDAGWLFEWAPLGTPVNVHD